MAKQTRRRKIRTFTQKRLAECSKIRQSRCFSTEIVILHLPNCVNGALRPATFNKEEFPDTTTRRVFQWKVFFSSPVDDYFEIDFFFVNLEGFSRKERSTGAERVSGSATATTARFVEMFFTRLSEQKVKISMKLWKKFIMSNLCNIQRKNSQTEPAISQQLGTQNEPNCATFVVRRLNSTSIVKTR